MTRPGWALVGGQKVTFFELFENFSPVPEGSSMVQMVMGRPPERFPSPESRPDSPGPAQRLSQVGPFGLFGPMTGPDRAIVGGQKSDFFSNFLDNFFPVPGGSSMVQMVIGRPPERFPPPESRPD